MTYIDQLPRKVKGCSKCQFLFNTGKRCNNFAEFEITYFGDREIHFKNDYIVAYFCSKHTSSPDKKDANKKK